MAGSSPYPMACDLYGDIIDRPGHTWRSLLPGLVVVCMATLAAGFIADRYAMPLTLTALLTGLALNFLSADERLDAGLAFASQYLLRAGIVLVGLRITFGQIADLGPGVLIATMIVMASVMLVAIGISRLLGFGNGFGVLAGGAVGICGASAAMAIASTLGERRISQAQLTLVLVGVSGMSAIAMIAYPILLHKLSFGDIDAGFVLGAAIHDVSQAIGAGYSFSDAAGQTAAIVKLTRVTLLAPVLAIIALCFRTETAGRRRPGVPLFVVGFFVMAGINSLGIVPGFVGTQADRLAAGLLAAAVTATAVRSPLRQLTGSGGRQLIVVAAATLTALAITLAAVRLGV